MKFDKIHNKGQAQIFSNRYVEMLTKTHPLVIWGIYFPLNVFLLFYSYATCHFSPAYILLIFLGGMLFWTLFEYMMHRFAFHFISENPRARRLVYILHGNHHQHPRDKERLFMPPVPSLIMSSIIFSLMYLLADTRVFVFFPGFVTGYLIYGTMHFAIHARNPPYKWMKPLWRNHHLHHYKNDNRGFGVSTTLWDRVFGTMYNLHKEKEDSEKVQQLMHD